MVIFALSHVHLAALSQLVLELALSHVHLAALSQLVLELALSHVHLAALSQLTLSYFVLDLDLDVVVLVRLQSVQLVVRFLAVVDDGRIDVGFWNDSHSVQLLKTFWIC